jgi:hypothetical protein
MNILGLGSELIMQIKEAAYLGARDEAALIGGMR